MVGSIWCRSTEVGYALLEYDGMSVERATADFVGKCLLVNV